MRKVQAISMSVGILVVSVMALSVLGCVAAIPVTVM
jgi:hypothetical protein